MDARFRTFADVAAHLDRLGLFHMDLTLGRMAAFARRAGLAGRLPFAAAHVVGTNGKGSTSAFLERLAREHGLRTGLYTSPHFLTFRERVRIDGRMLPESRWVSLAERAWELGAGPDDLGLTYFELLTAVALLAFAEERVDLAVLEAGLGGRYDAVTAVPATLTAFTPIGLDHMAVLGPDIAAIAADKAGAVRPGGLAVSGPQPPQALEGLRRAAAEAGATLAADLPDLPPGANLGLAGGFQRANARLALGAWRLLARANGWAADSAAERRGLERAFIPGRLQPCPGDPPLILDGGHNAPALEALGDAMAQAVQGLPNPPAAVIFSCLKDKDLAAMAPLVARLSAGPVIVPGLPGCDRARDPAEVAAFFSDSGPGGGSGRGMAVADVAAALEMARAAGAKGPVLACGSLYLLAEVYALRPHCLPDIW